MIVIVISQLIVIISDINQLNFLAKEKRFQDIILYDAK